MISVQVRFSAAAIALEDIPNHDYKAILTAVQVLTEHGVPLKWSNLEDYDYEVAPDPLEVTVVYGADHFSPSPLFKVKDELGAKEAEA